MKKFYLSMIGVLTFCLMSISSLNAQYDILRNYNPSDTWVYPSLGGYYDFTGYDWGWIDGNNDIMTYIEEYQVTTPIYIHSFKIYIDDILDFYGTSELQVVIYDGDLTLGWNTVAPIHSEFVPYANLVPGWNTITFSTPILVADNFMGGYTMWGIDADNLLVYPDDKFFVPFTQPATNNTVCELYDWGSLSSSWYLASAFGYGNISLIMEYETEDANLPLCSGTPTGGTVTVTPNANYDGQGLSLTSVGYTDGFMGLSYTWQVNFDDGQGWLSLPSTPLYSNGFVNLNGMLPNDQANIRLQVECAYGGTGVSLNEDVFTLLPPPDPCDDITVMECGKTYNATLTPSYSNWDTYGEIGNQWGLYEGSEHVFSYTAPVTGTYTFWLSEGNADADFFLMTGTCGDLDQESLFDNGDYVDGWDFGPESVVVNLTQGVTYYLIADLWDDEGTTVAVRVDCIEDACGQGYVSDWVTGSTDDGLLMSTVDDSKVANDIVIPPTSMFEMKTLTFNVISLNDFNPLEMDIEIFEDDGAGNIGATTGYSFHYDFFYEGGGMEVFFGDLFWLTDNVVWAITLDLPDVQLVNTSNQEKRYWIVISTDDDIGAYYMTADDYVSNPNSLPSKIYDIPTSTWDDTDLECVMWVQGICKEAFVWEGTVNSNWADEDNWFIGLIPAGCGDNVTIPVTPNNPVISGNEAVGDIEVRSGAMVSFNGGSLSVCGDVFGDGILGNATGTVIMNGDDVQVIDDASTVNVGTLQIDNEEGVLNGGQVTINSSLDLVSGIFDNAFGSVILNSNGSSFSAYLDDFSEGFSGEYDGDITVHTSLFSSQSSATQNKKKGYRQISSPVTGATVGNALSHLAFGPTGMYANNSSLTSANFPTIWIYNETHKKSFNDNWYSYGGGLGSMQGINVRVKSPTIPNLAVNFTGNPHTGSYSRTLTNSGGILDGKGWNFIGNPYPSPISWSNVNKGSSDGNAYLFHTEGEYSGTYGTLNSQGVGTNGASNTIAIGQGFLVYTNQATGTIQFTNDDRVADDSPLFYGKPSFLPNELRIKLTNGESSDEVLNYTDGLATVEVDEGLDALKLPSKGDVHIAYVVNGGEFAINVMDAVEENTVLPLTMSVTTTGVYELQLVQENIIGLTPFLKNIKTGVLQRMDVESSILLMLEEEVVYDNYEIVFTDALSTFEEDAPDNIIIFSDNNEVHIRRSSNEKATINISNLLGQTIVSTETTEQNLTLTLEANQASWVAIVKVQENDLVKTTKVLIRK